MSARATTFERRAQDTDVRMNNIIPEARSRGIFSSSHFAWGIFLNRHITSPHARASMHVTMEYRALRGVAWEKSPCKDTCGFKRRHEPNQTQGGYSGAL